MAFIKSLLALGLNQSIKIRDRNNACKINNNNSQSHSVVRLSFSTMVSSCIESTNFDWDNNQVYIDQAYDDQTKSKHCGVTK